MISDAHGPSKLTVCRVVHQVAQAVNFVLFPEVVSWPKGENLKQVPHQLWCIAGMPFVAGCVDGMLVPILAPHENEEQFVD